MPSMKSTYREMHEAMERDGDPSDETLNYIEETTLWPRIVENRAKNVSCLEEKNATERCRKKYGTIFGFMCAYDNIIYSQCVREKKTMKM
ncbi:hypothetical protein ONE63_006513 [Megalurothrips usitatus]|uniref:Uncharacterized protein n=1 Tax=Megalurothrips usitatus TaxID=439358 RepID=A0AAV7XWU2_9NEOP|nr:hypothetical protein ONE63_006513 [Megalurothrips usitatus]